MKVVLIGSQFMATIHAPRSVDIVSVSKCKASARSSCLKEYAKYIKSL